MGDAPPKDLPSPEQAPLVDAGFPDSPTALSLCGFKLPLPSIAFNFGFHLPKLPFPPLPSFTLGLAINCDTSNPLGLTGGLKWGGHRVGTKPPSGDHEP